MISQLTFIPCNFYRFEQLLCNLICVRFFVTRICFFFRFNDRILCTPICCCFANLFAPCHCVCIPQIFQKKKHFYMLMLRSMQQSPYHALMSILPEIVCKFCLSRGYSTQSCCKVQSKTKFQHQIIIKLLGACHSFFFFLRKKAFKKNTFRRIPSNFCMESCLRRRMIP